MPALNSTLKTTFRHIREGWTIVGLTLLLLVGLEGASRVYLVARAIVTDRIGGKYDSPEHATIVKHPWGKQYIDDLAQMRFAGTYRPYVAFRALPRRLDTIATDDDGLRVTPQPVSQKEAEYSLWAFGGSTMYGVGSPDDSTIPAYLASLFHENDRRDNVHVLNVSGEWWVSSQGCAQLIVMLQQGRIPDAVVFYDGINDSSVVTVGGRPGEIAPDVRRRLERGLAGDPSALDVVLGRSTFLSSVSRLGAANGRAYPAPDGLHGSAQEVVSIYENNVRIISALGQEYGFESYFFWQPFPLISTKPATADEAGFLERRRDMRPWELTYFREVYRLVGESVYLEGLTNFRNLSALFEHTDEEVFADSEHLLPSGNKLVAQAMFQAMAEDR